MPITFDGAAFSTGITVSMAPLPNQNALFGYGTTGAPNSTLAMTNTVSNLGVVASDVVQQAGTGNRYGAGATGYGTTGQCMFGFGIITPGVRGNYITRYSNAGVLVDNSSGVGTAREAPCGFKYGLTGTAMFIYGSTLGGVVNIVNLISTVGVVAADTSSAQAGTLNLPAAANFGSTGQTILGYGILTPTVTSVTRIISNTGVVAADTPGVGTARVYTAVATYGQDKAIFGYGTLGNFTTNVSVTNLVSNVGVVAADTTGVGTARQQLSAGTYGGDKAIFGYGTTVPGAPINTTSTTNLVSSAGVVASDTPGVGTSRARSSCTSFN